MYEIPSFVTTNGLLLLENEKEIFPQELVRPQWGLSDPDESDPRQIITYQVNADVCPFYVAHGCEIHGKRPLICRAFPVQLLDWKTGALRWSRNCTWIHDHFGTGAVSDLEAASEVNVADALASILASEVQTVSFPTIHWNYDLKTQSWKMLSDLSH